MTINIIPERLIDNHVTLVKGKYSVVVENFKKLPPGKSLSIKLNSGNETKSAYTAIKYRFRRHKLLAQINMITNENRITIKKIT